MDGMTDEEIAWKHQREKFVDSVTELDKKRSKSAKRISAFGELTGVCKEIFNEALVGKYKMTILREIRKTLNVSTQHEEIQQAIKVTGHLLTYDNLFVKDDFEDIITKLKQSIENALQKTEDVDWIKLLLSTFALHALYYESHHDIHHQVIPYLQKLLYRTLRGTSNISKQFSTLVVTPIIRLIASFPTASYKITWFERLHKKFIDICDLNANKVNTEFKLMVGEFFALSYEALATQMQEYNVEWDNIVKDDWEDMIPLVENYDTIHNLMQQFTGYFTGVHAKGEKRLLRNSFRLFSNAIEYYRQPNEMNEPEPKRIKIAKQEVLLSTIRQRLIYDLVKSALGSLQHLFFGSTTFCNMIDLSDTLESWATINEKQAQQKTRPEWNTQRSQADKLDTLDKKKATRSKIQFSATGY